MSRTLDYISINVLENLSNILEYEENVCQDVTITYPYDKSTTEIIDKQDHLPNSNNIPKVFGYKSEDNKVFGYKNETPSPKKIISKALIKTTPERRFLKGIGLLNDNQNSGGPSELPIIAFFKSGDNVIKDCIIDEIVTSIRNSEEIIEIIQSYKVSDVRALGHYGVNYYIYILTPNR